MNMLVDSDGVAKGDGKKCSLSESIGSSINNYMVEQHLARLRDMEQSTSQRICTSDLCSYQNQYVTHQATNSCSCYSSVSHLGSSSYQKTRSGYVILPEDNSDKLEKNNLLSYTCNYNPYNNSNDHKKDEKDDKTGSITTIFTVWNTIMGSSLLTMAWGIERSGLIPGIILMIIMGGLCLFTSYIILNVNKYHGNSYLCEISDLCEILLGKWWKRVSEVFSFIVMIGANIIYWVLMTSFLYHSVLSMMAYKDNSETSSVPTQHSMYDGVLCKNNKTISATIDNNANHKAGWSSVFWDQNYSVPLYVTVIIFPLINIKNDKFFKQFTSLGTLSVVYLIIFISVKATGWGVNIDSLNSLFTIKPNFTALSGMLALSFYIHNIIITVMSTNRNEEKNGRDLSIAFVLVIITYILAGSIFYVCFPLPKSCIEDNILNNFVKNDLLTAVARVLLLFQIVTVYPLIAFMLRKQVLGSLFPEKINSNLYISIFNVLLMIVCILFACFVPKIGTIIRYTGALSGLVHIFTLPSLLQMTSLYRRRKLTIIKVIFYVSIFLIGFCNLIAQFFVGD